MYTFILAWSSLLMFSLGVRAQSSSDGATSLRMDDVRGDRNAVSGNIDDEITNAKLRAESGSKSRWSASASTDFKGGTVDDAFGASRPQLVAEPGKQDNTSVDAGLSARFRWTKNDSLTLGTNFGLNTPFRGRVDADQSQFNVYDPELSYNRVGRLGAVQSNGKVTLSPGTSSQSRDVDRVMTYAAENVFLHAFRSRVTAGLALEGVYNQYATGAGGNAANRRALASVYGDAGQYYGGDSRTAWGVGAFPYLEYAFSDRYQVRTVFGWFNYRHLYGDDHSGRLLRAERVSVGGPRGGGGPRRVRVPERAVRAG